MTNKRIKTLDILRGLAVIFILLFHSSIYNFSNIHNLDFSNPPILIVLISFLALWSGIFIFYSLIVNTIMILRRKQNNSSKIFLHLTYASIIYLIFHFLLNFFLGRWNIDFVNNTPDLTFVASAIRNLNLTLPPITNLFKGSSLSTIALNLMIVSWVLFLLFRNNGEKKQVRNYFLLGIIGFLIMILSFVRVPLYSLYTEAMDTNNYFLSILYSFLLANPYPLLPYLSYGFFGALAGLIIFNELKDLLKKVLIPLGIIFIVFGFIGILNFDKTISEPDYFWYFKTNFELGLFLLILSITYLIIENRKKSKNKFPILSWFSRICFTIYMLETLLSEIVRLILTPIIPTWHKTIEGSLVFGVLNIFIWVVILFFWNKINFKYSLEYFWVKLFNKFGKQSSK